MAAIQQAHQKMKADNKIVINTRLEKSRKLSEKYDANIYLKREDNQPGRTFKIRGGFNYISKMSEADRKKGNKMIDRLVKGYRRITEDGNRGRVLHF